MANEKSRISLRHIQIDKANALMVAAIAGAAACLVFSLVSVAALYQQAKYNAKVIKAKETTVTQIKNDINSLGQLKTSYEAFVREPTNIIGGSSVGQGNKDGDNAKITLDAMPSVYDFPGTVSGFNKILNESKSYNDPKINGSDQELTEQANTTAAPVELPFSASANGSAAGVQDFLSVLDRSIRPMSVKSVSFSGDSSGNLDVSAQLTVFYQPKMKFEVKTEVIK